MKFVFAFFLILTTLPAWAVELFETNQSIRALGMGNAYITNASGTDALFYNPSALSKVKGLNWDVVNVHAGINGLGIYDDIKDITKQSSQPSDYTKFYGKNIWVDANGKSAFALPNFGFAAYTDNQADLRLHNPAYPQFNTNFISDYGFIVGGSLPLGNDFALGATIKRVNRWGGDQDIGAGTIAAGGNLDKIKDSFQNKGVGYGMDASMMYTAPTVFHPSMAVVWQDIGNTTFQKTSGTEAPPQIDSNLTAGIGSSVDLPGISWSNSFDVRHINDNAVQFGQKVHLGTEVSLPLIDLRAGINEGYIAYGAGIDLFFLHLDAAYYTEELGAYPGQTPDNRIQIGVSIDLSFDADFKFTDNNGKARKLKLRR